jgi:RNA polymerase sigma-70 factor (ECF subfamily)
MNLDRETLDGLFRYGYALTADEDHAYALLQHAMQRYLESGQQARSPVAYLRTTMRNRFIDERRRQQRFPEVALEEAGDVLDVGVASLESQMIARSELDRVWRKLLPAEREILYMWAVKGYSTGELAREWEVSRNTILSRIHRLRQRLKTWASGETAEGGSR